ncbi:hypothetical protein EHZ13_08530 [Clostridium perfringens]|uniref:hypothetical protein n=1 Tax=Clostridium perfringens TaxID=1502 RepID=UPI000F51BA98|nr:hypothetical protein [Clostridium perfringens]MCC5434660.1 hypothetical protein [Clostridium perfringens]MCC5436987.1 hypothetical protein [Clostridium perfringens]MDK0762256.1 hypothetical protein [Clostridium perfringens]MDK3121444.1 hypothetical protein [Clostridium perfringens]MDM0793408.1 hypothetical protein [Clostridium perfringens]
MNFFNKNEEENSSIEEKKLVEEKNSVGEKSAVEVTLNKEGNVENVTFDKSEAVAYGVDLEKELEDEKNNEVDEQGELLNPIPTPVKQGENMLDYVVTLSDEQKIKLNEFIQANDFSGVSRLLSEHKRIISTPKELFNIVLNFNDSKIIPFKSAMVLGLDEIDAFNVLARQYPILKELERNKISIKRINRVQQSQIILVDGEMKLS